MRGEGHKVRMVDAADADKTLRTIALYSLVTMSMLGCLGTGVFVAAGRLDVARSIVVVVATIGAAGVLMAVVARRCPGAVMALGFILKMAAMPGIFSAFDSWAGLNRRALVVAVALGIAASLAIDSRGASRQREGFQECKDFGEREDFEKHEGFEEREGLKERNGGRDGEAADAPS